jgi:hypothetical protein
MNNLNLKSIRDKLDLIYDSILQTQEDGNNIGAPAYTNVSVAIRLCEQQEKLLDYIADLERCVEVQKKGMQDFISWFDSMVDENVHSPLVCEYIEAKESLTTVEGIMKGWKDE